MEVLGLSGKECRIIQGRYTLRTIAWHLDLEQVVLPLMVGRNLSPNFQCDGKKCLFVLEPIEKMSDFVL